MKPRPLRGEQTLLRIFCGEHHEAVMEKARKMGIAGCTAFRGISGFGVSGAVHAEFPPDYAENLPIVVEIVDTAERAAALLKEIEPLLGGALVTEEKLRVHHYKGKK